MDRLGWTAAALLAGCGPVVSSGGSTGGGDGGGESSAASPSTSVSATTDDSAEASGVSVTTSTTDPFGTTGDPSSDCPNPIDGLTQLWCGDVDPDGPIAADDDWVYFATLQESIARVPVEGGEVDVLVASTGDVTDLLREGDTLYWTTFEDGTFGRVTLPDGPPEQLATGLFKPNSIAVLGTAAFISQYGAPYPILRIELESGTQSVLYDAQNYADDIFAWGGRLYFNTSANNGNNQTPLVVGDGNGGPLETIVSGRWVANDLEAADVDTDGPTLWWARYEVAGSGIMRTVLAPGRDETQEIFATPFQPITVATTARRVYWTEWEMGTSRVRSVTREGLDPQQHHEDQDAGRLVTTRLGVVFATEQVLLRIDGS